MVFGELRFSRRELIRLIAPDGRTWHFDIAGEFS